MKAWSKIKRWEKSLEKKPRGHFISLLTFIFYIFLIIGVVIATCLYSFYAQTIKAIERDIAASEVSRMNGRVELMKFIKYGKKY